MKFGIKIWSTNRQLIKLARKYYQKGDYDYLELSAIVGSFDDSLMRHLEGIPMVIHCDNFGVNFADRSLRKNNLKAVKEAKMFADHLKADYIIVHPGHDGSYEEINKIIAVADDDRICVENMPGKTLDLKHVCLGRTKEELQRIKAKHYCLDFSHAIKASASLGIDHRELIKELNFLNPVVCHISDGMIGSELDEHLDIGAGNYDFKEFIEYVVDASLLTLEITKKSMKSLENDLTNLKRLQKIFL